jgi:hypothetical protein
MAASDQDLGGINKEYINSISTGELKIIWSFNRTQVYVSPAGKVNKRKNGRNKTYLSILI